MKELKIGLHFAITDERLVTGQNPASGADVAKQVLELLK